MGRPDKPRDPVAGPDSGPQSPFPIRLSGPVIKGFGRGSKELGIPTANIPPDGLSEYPDLESGVYYGVVALDPAKFVYDSGVGDAVVNSSSNSGSDLNGSSNGNSNSESLSKGDAAAATATDTATAKAKATILPAVLSIGYNPFYKNTVRSVEIHIMTPLSSPSPSPSTIKSTTAPKGEEQEQPQPHPEPNPARRTFNKLPDFYSTNLNLLILGYIRPEYDYVSLEALIEDIRVDCEVARRSLEREGYVCYFGEYRNEKGEGDCCGEDVRGDREWLVTF